MTDRRDGLTPLTLLLLVDLLVLATFVASARDADAPGSVRVLFAFVAVLALVLGGLTVVRIVRRLGQRHDAVR